MLLPALRVNKRVATIRLHQVIRKQEQHVNRVVRSLISGSVTKMTSKDIRSLTESTPSTASIKLSAEERLFFHIEYLGAKRLFPQFGYSEMPPWDEES